jgi:hypothetical protein
MISGTVALPAGLNLVQILDQDGWDTASESLGVITATAPTLGVGASLTLSFRVQASEQCNGVVTIASGSRGSFSIPGCVKEIISADASECPVACSGTSPVCAFTGVGGNRDDDDHKADALNTPTPNPFKNSTRIAYAVRAGGARVAIGVYNTAGQRVRNLTSGAQPEGHHEALWDGRDDSCTSVSAGVYFFRTVVGEQSTVTRIVYMR